MAHNLLFSTTTPVKKRLHPGKYYQEQWCKAQDGQVEVVLPDKTRCDCLTDTHAIEFDFGNKWAESIGQALNYAIQTGKKAGVVLILEKKSDYKYWISLNTIIDHYALPIDTWKVGSLTGKTTMWQLYQPSNDGLLRKWASQDA